MKKEDFIKKENTQLELKKNRSASIKVIGVGGGGSNALSHMFEQGITGVDFIACNTDAQALNNNPVPIKIQLGASITEGLGAGADPEVGEKAALESLEEIKSILDSNTKMTFITAGMGGGTGTGAAPIIAGISKEKGILTVGIVTIPFHFEGKMRLQQAQKGIEALRKNVDSLIVINNDKLRELYGNLGFKAGFAKADEVLTTAAKGIAEVITHHYKQNIDLRDTRTVLKESGTAVMGSSIAVGENRAKEAVVQALDSPLLNDNKITGAKNVLLLIVSGKIEITIDEIGIISDYIQTEAGNNANIIMGIGEDDSLEEAISVTIVATGFPTEIQRAINHEEKKIFHRLEEPYEQRLNKIEEIHSYSKRIDPYFSKIDSSHLDYKSKKNDFSSNQKQNIFDQSINSNFFIEKKHKKYMLEDNFDLPISYNENEKILKKRIRKKENNTNQE
ncbi:cell division protein FtsZ [Blattabacterium cuenoti]|uniref:cell division protein FtsZ n=1 Tax=Blattabacterium cuenoti TaxID=1653831 RepID=UPI00163BAC9B|nr:cell division protein FtsZ [Blattabacterium cuenoti]